MKTGYSERWPVFFEKKKRLVRKKFEFYRVQPLIIKPGFARLKFNWCSLGGHGGAQAA
jgi:hypothetical protein